MKKLTMIFAVLAVMAGTSAFASSGDKAPSGDKVSKTVQAAFQQGFAGAENVTWETAEDFYFASFDLNGTSVNAAYNEKAELVGVSRKLQLSEIPETVSKSLKSEYGDYEISNTVTEVVYEGDTFYYATVKGITKTLKLKCFSDGQIYVEKKTKK